MLFSSPIRFAMSAAAFMIALSCAAAQDTVTIHVGDAWQDSVNVHGWYCVFLIDSGVHRLQEVVPDLGSVFAGKPGAVMSGARILTHWVQSGALWAHGDQTQKGRYYGLCQDNYPACLYPEDLYLDNQMLKRVAMLAQVQAGSWYFDYETDSVYMADNPAGHVMEISVASRAIGGPGLHVTVKNLIIEKYATPSQLGAIDGDYPGEGWVIENCEIRLNHATGIQLRCRNALLRNNKVHHNGQKGIGIVDGGDSSIVEGNEIAYNNYLQGYSFGWEGGGAKFVWSRNLIIRNNHVHHNFGAGLWTDIGCNNTLFEGNRCEYNAAEGIFHEISDTAIIRCNLLRFNATLMGSNLQLGNSSNTQVYGNVVEVAADKGDAIIIVQNDRPDFTNTSRWLAKGNDIHHNHIIHKGAGGASGGYCEYDCANFWAAGGNRFDHNTYHTLSAGGPHWAWSGSAMTFAQFKAAGFETDGTVDADTNSMDSVPNCRSFADIRERAAESVRGAGLMKIVYDRASQALRVTGAPAFHDQIRMSVFNASGRLVFAATRQCGSALIQSFDARAIPAGTYCVQIETERTSARRRILLLR